MSRWKYFTDEESVGLADDLCFKRDRAREFYGDPIVQTCGIRSSAQAILDGCPHSAHVTGKAFDMAAPTDPAGREKLMWALGLAGFRRVESAPKHFHADTDDFDKPSPCFWVGTDH